MSTTRRALGDVTNNMKLVSHHNSVASRVRKGNSVGLPTAKKTKATSGKLADITPRRLRQTNLPQNTPFVSPKTTLKAVNTPATPRGTRAMMDQRKSPTKPQRDHEALHIIELQAFKLDAAAFNSYLYTGKMVVPPNSAIAQEDRFSDMGAKLHSNIRTKTSSISKNLFEDSIAEEDGQDSAYDTDDMEQDLTEDEAESKGSRRLSTITRNARTTRQRTPAMSAVKPRAPLTSRAFTPLPISTRSTRSTPAGTRANEPRIVDVLIKYPLMGSVEEWKDTFQTCAEEVEMYRNIETWRCPYLLRYYGTHGPGVVFEFVDGDALDTLLDVDGPMLYEQDWSWSELGLHTCTALKYLQERHISHNDLKPANVRYSKTKQMWKLLDLGLATDLDMKVSKGIGTDGYRAPEVAAQGTIHVKSDVFGLGVMMEDAFESLKTRYRVMSKCARSYQDVLRLVEEEAASGVNDEQGDIDVETERVMIFKDFARDKFPGMTVEDAEELMDACVLWDKVYSDMQEVIACCLEEDPEDRPSIKRLIHVFRTLCQREKRVQEAFSQLRKYNVY